VFFSRFGYDCISDPLAPQKHLRCDIASVYFWNYQNFRPTR